MRFSIAAYILAERGERRAINILVKKVKSNHVNTNIHFSACGALAQLSPEIAKGILGELVEKYRKLTWNKMPNHNSAAYQRYENALHVLAVMKDERIYSICLKMAESGDRLEKESSMNGMLYHFDNHWEEVLPLYVKCLNDKNSYDIASIAGIKNMKRPEAIPILEEFASKNSMYKREVGEVVEYLKSLQK
ncbi:MAG: hypothetical protein WCY36_04570 [Candidatus Omnitrophota bacterium]